METYTTSPNPLFKAANKLVSGWFDPLPSDDVIASRPVMDLSVLALHGVRASKTQQPNSLEQLAHLVHKTWEVRPTGDFANLGFDDAATRDRAVDGVEKRCRDDGFFSVVQCDWTDGYFLENGDASHRLAIAYWHAQHANRPYTLTQCRVRTDAIDQEHLQTILDRTYSVIVHEQSAAALGAALAHFRIPLTQISFKGSGEYSSGVPSQSKRRTIVYLHKRHLKDNAPVRHVRAAYEVIASRAPDKCFDLHQYLGGLRPRP